MVDTFEMVEGEPSESVTKSINVGIPGSVINRHLDEAVRDLKLSQSWEVFLCEHLHWNIPVTIEEFKKIYSEVSRGLIGGKLWMIMPIIGVYFGRLVLNWDDQTWNNKSADSPTAATILVDKKMSWLWSEIVNEETNETVGIHYHAAYLWDLISSKKIIRMIVMYDEDDANQVCCHRKFYVRKTPTEKAQDALLHAQKVVEMKKR